MSLTCEGHFMRDCPDLIDYKFYLAFENAPCSEYITEKLWWNAYSKVSDGKIKYFALCHEQGAVPIVLGGLDEADYLKLAPPNSYLHVDHYQGPDHLAAQVEPPDYRLLHCSFSNHL